MHPNIPGYRLTQELHRSPRTLVLRAVREADGRSVVVKTIPKAYPEPQDEAPQAAPSGDGEAKVVSLDQFRKK